MIRQVANLKDKAGSEIRAWDKRTTGKLKAGITLLKTKVKNKVSDVKTTVKAPTKRIIARTSGKAKAVLYGRSRHTLAGKLEGTLKSNQVKVKNVVTKANNLVQGYKKAGIQYGTGLAKGKLIQTGSKIRREWR